MGDGVPQVVAYDRNYRQRARVAAGACGAAAAGAPWAWAAYMSDRRRTSTASPGLSGTWRAVHSIR